MEKSCSPKDTRRYSDIKAMKESRSPLKNIGTNLVPGRVIWSLRAFLSVFSTKKLRMIKRTNPKACRQMSQNTSPFTFWMFVPLIRSEETHLFMMPWPVGTAHLAIAAPKIAGTMMPTQVAQCFGFPSSTVLSDIRSFLKNSVSRSRNTTQTRITIAAMKDKAVPNSFQRKRVGASFSILKVVVKNSHADFTKEGEARPAT